MLIKTLSGGVEKWVENGTNAYGQLKFLISQSGEDEPQIQIFDTLEGVAFEFTRASGRISLKADKPVFQNFFCPTDQKYFFSPASEEQYSIRVSLASTTELFIDIKDKDNIPVDDVLNNTPFEFYFYPTT
jgi:hypothetical protein